MNKRIGGIVLCVLMICSLVGCKSPGEMIDDGAAYINGQDPIGDAKQIVFDQINADATLGEMVNMVLHDITWSKEPTGNNTYKVTVTGTIEDDIPSYRDRGGELFCAVLGVEYFNDQCRVTVDDGYWGSHTGSYSSVEYLSAAYSVATGQFPANMMIDEYTTSNPKFPIYSGSSAAPSQGASGSVNSQASSNSGQTAAAPSKPQNSGSDMEDIQEARFDTMHAMYVGTWKSYQGGEDTDDDGVLETYPENEVTLVLNDNGTGSITSYGYTRTFTWEAGSTMTGDATGTWDDLEYEYGPLYFDMQMIDDNTITADLTEDGGTWIVYFRK